jgi:hypothetical protein
MQRTADGNFRLERVPPPGTGVNHFLGVATQPDGTTWAVGDALDPKSGNLRTLIETAPTGSGWSLVASPNPSASGDNQLGGVAVIGRHDLWAVGDYDGPIALRSLILHYCPAE